MVNIGELLAQAKHSSIGLITAEQTGELLMSRYDAGYPRAAYRGRAVLIGGNRDPQDLSPGDTYVRELHEELSCAPQFASYIGARSKGVRSYLCTAPSFPAPLVGHVFAATINQEFWEQLRNDLPSLSAEGDYIMRSLQQLQQGDPICAWASGAILNDVYGVQLANPEQVEVIRLGDVPKHF